MEEKKRVELYDVHDGEVYERLLLTDEQIRLVEYLEDRDCLNDCVNVRVLEEDYTYTEV